MLIYISRALGYAYELITNISIVSEPVPCEHNFYFRIRPHYFFGFGKM